MKPVDNNGNKKSHEAWPGRALPDEALDAVSGGSEGEVLYGDLSAHAQYSKFFKQFESNSNCDDCRSNWDCAILDMDEKDIYAMFGGDPNAKCPNFKTM